MALYQERVSEAGALEEKIQAANTREANLADVVASRTEESRELNIELEVLRRRVARLSEKLEKYRAIADEDATTAQRMAAAKVSIGKALASYLRDKKIGLEQSQQKLVLQLSDRILFDSGSAELRVDGVELLRSVGNTLKNSLGGLSVQIGGHTDNVPMRAFHPGAPRGNWALSAARAVNVVRFLEQEIGLSPDQLSATGYGEFQPVADNHTAKGRALNRRIEIVLAPR